MKEALAHNVRPVRVRIAPSPTGPLHIGTARTALFNYLFAKRYGGTFILRIDDTDAERSKKKFEDDVVDGLRWLNIVWDEGVGAAGDCGPYQQSERIHIYRKYLEMLLREKKAYHCFCAEEESTARNEEMTEKNLPPKYPGTCRAIPEEEKERLMHEGRPWVLRFAVPEKTVAFDDLIRGRITFDASLLGDFVIAKNMEAPLYNFASVVDDHEMRISHIIRGEDHISNTPKQMLMQEALGFPAPYFAHLPLILGSDKSKLSKRNAVVSIDDYKADGYLAPALINFMAFLGWNPGDDREIFSLAELVAEFDIAKVQKSPAMFNIQKLDWLNGNYIRSLSGDDLFEKAFPLLSDAGLLKKRGKDIYEGKDGSIYNEAFIKRALLVEQNRMKKLSEIPEAAAGFLVSDLDYDPVLLVWKKATAEDAVDALRHAYGLLRSLEDDVYADPERMKEFLTKEAKIFDAHDMGKLFWPLRVALSGKKASPAPFELMYVLQKERSLHRIQKAADILERSTL